MFRWANFLTYALVTAITPGPNNLSSMSNAGRLGIKRALPFNFGIWVGFSLVMLGCTLFCGTLSAFLPALKLPMLDGVDALLDQLPRFLALVPRFGKADGRVVAQREPRPLAAQLEAVAPSLHPIGLHFEVKAAKVIQAVELLLRFGSTAVGICKHGVTRSAIRNDRRIIYTFRRLVQSSYTPA